MELDYRSVGPVLVVLLLLCSVVARPQGKSSGAAKAALARQNMVGKLANDFVYVTPGGEKRKMRGISAEFTLLFFYNPECEACKEYKGLLSRSAVLNGALASGRLKVLAMYIDRDLSVWKKHLPLMPKAWIQGRDQEDYLFRNGVYDLHAIPTIYLLDRQKRVVLKDVLSVGMIEQALRR